MKLNREIDTLKNIQEQIKNISGESETLQEIHPESKGSSGIVKTNANMIKMHVSRYDKTLSSIAEAIENKLDEHQDESNRILEEVKKQEERMFYNNLISTSYPIGDQAIKISEESFFGSFDTVKEEFFLPIKNIEEVGYEVINITGNGIIGNQYIYKNGEKSSDIIDTSNIEILKSDRKGEYFEYQKLHYDKDEGPLMSGNSPATMTMILKGAGSINCFRISGNRSYKISFIEISNDNKNYRQVFNGQNKNDVNYEYIYFSPSKYVKVTFEAKSEEYVSLEVPYGNNDLKSYKNIKRSMIQISQIEGFFMQYENNGNIKFTKSFDRPATIFGLYAEIAYPQESRNHEVEIVVTINESSYNIVPINSHKEGIKVLQTVVIEDELPFNSIKKLGSYIKDLEILFRIRGDKHNSPRIKNVYMILRSE